MKKKGAEWLAVEAHPRERRGGWREGRRGVRARRKRRSQYP